MSIALDTNGPVTSSPLGHSSSRISLSSLSSYPSALNMISNDIYLNTISSLNNAFYNVEKLSQFSFQSSDGPQILTLDLEKIENDGEKTPKMSFSIKTSPHDTDSKESQNSGKILSKPNVNNRMIRTFLRFLRPTKAKKRINKKLNSKITNSVTSDSKMAKSKKNTIGRSKFRSIGVINSSDDVIRIRSNEKKNSKKSSFSSSSNSSTNHKKNHRAKRALSLITKSTKFSTSASVSSISCSSPTNLNNTSMFSTNETSVHSSNFSKELNWYRLEELDHYYKILGNPFASS